MPIYLYECGTCEEVFKVRHGMSETCECCILCGSNVIERKVSTFTNLSKQKDTVTKVGDTTKEFIENSKDDLKIQIEELKKKR
tara:strand:- start:2699 stop:2947 length:249 start_codon:yes stop_codon:yes gene_type:complete